MRPGIEAVEELTHIIERQAAIIRKLYSVVYQLSGHNRPRAGYCRNPAQGGTNYGKPGVNTAQGFSFSERR
jgi:hypothetical protein